MNIIHRVTLKTLKKNKTRTIVTIIGVILSAAMITAVTTFISSMQNLMVKSIISIDGRWQASVSQVPYQDISAVTDNDKVKESGIQHTLGYAKLEGSRNSSKPYLFVQAFDSKSMELYSFKLREGRMPENENEIVISEQIRINGGVAYAVGDTVTLNIGDRIGADGTVLTQRDPFTKGIPESLVTKTTRTYTVVGIAEKPSYEVFNAPGYSVVTFLNTSSLKASDKVNVAYCMKNPREILKFAPGLVSTFSIDNSQSVLHKDLIEYMGISQNQNFNFLLYTFGSIFIGLIMIGSVSLIYNAFAISISERSKQFGMLSGVGATSRQIRNAVFFEAVFIGIIGIPIGILSGIFGIGVTLYLLRDIFNSFTNTGVPFTISVSVPSIIVAAVVGFVTILLSAWLPAHRASRVSSIEAIKQTGEVKIKRKNVKTSRFVRRIFGMEGDIALKNFRRNRRRYRATVISLVISIVLFISASSFSMYMKTGVEAAYTNVNFDILVSPAADTTLSDEDTQKMIDAVKSTDNYERCSVVNGLRGTVSVDQSFVRPELLKGDQPAVKLNKDDTAAVSYALYTVDDEEFERYIEQSNLKLSDYTDTSHPKGIVLDKQQYYDSKGKLNSGRLFKTVPQTLDFHNSQFNTENDTARQTVPLALESGADVSPLGVDFNNYVANQFTVIVSNKVYTSLFGSFPKEDIGPTFVGIKTSNPDIVDENLQNTFKQQGLINVTTENIAKLLKLTRNVLLVVNVFTFGFIILITLIAVANVFNTISTNVNLRRREFAMLKSVGMTPQGFNRMVNFECVFYGLKALLFGLPISLAVTYLIYRSLAHVIGIGFQIPWLNILFCTVAVFLIVFITMMYSMSKVRKENIIDALKNENQ